MSADLRLHSAHFDCGAPIYISRKAPITPIPPMYISKKAPITPMYISRKAPITAIPPIYISRKAPISYNTNSTNVYFKESTQ